MVLAELVELLLESAEGAFIEVGVFVGAILLIFALIDLRNEGKFIGYIEKSKGWQPLIGSLLGLTPGCGGAIFVMPLFFKGSVTFGTVVATLMATMGDSAFVLIATSPLHWLLVSVLSLLVAVITGYGVDRTNLGSRILEKYRQAVGTAPPLEQLTPKSETAVKLSQPLTLFVWFFWGLLLVGLVLGIMDLAQVDANELLGLVIGITGTVISLAIMVFGRRYLRNLCSGEKNLTKTLITNLIETAFVITWVFVGYMAYELIVLGAGSGDYASGEMVIESLLLAAGIASVFVAVAVGIIPGCGPQIIFVSLFAQGLVPFAALAANAVSQDGDALFPILAMDRPSAIWATFINKLPALALGLGVFWLERNFNFGQLLEVGTGIIEKIFA